jgi:hypothetical protein
MKLPFSVQDYFVEFRSTFLHRRLLMRSMIMIRWTAAQLPESVAAETNMWSRNAFLRASFSEI